MNSDFFELRLALPDDWSQIVELFRKSQAATGKPDPTSHPPEDLADHLQQRVAIERWLAVLPNGRVVGHGIIEQLSVTNTAMWRRHLPTGQLAHAVELGAAFTDPELMGKGIHNALFRRRLERVQSLGRQAVSCTWADNEHVVRTYLRFGGREVGSAAMAGCGSLVRLFIFDQKA